MNTLRFIFGFLVFWVIGFILFTTGLTFIVGFIQIVITTNPWVLLGGGLLTGALLLIYAVEGRQKKTT